MPHFFIKSSDIVDDKIVISDKENYNHIAKSLRVKSGEKLLLIDEDQIQYETKIDVVSKQDISVTVVNKYKSERKLPFDLYLAQVPLRSDSQNFIIEKATELGVTGIFPTYSDNCALNKSVIEKKIPKYQRIMYEASKQCERANIPVCYEIKTFDKIITMKDIRIIAFCERCANLTLHEYCKTLPIKNNDKILVLIGPEGGFSQKEFDTMREKNIPMLTLGDLILKAETAVTVALGNIIYEFNNYKN